MSMIMIMLMIMLMIMISIMIIIIIIIIIIDFFVNWVKLLKLQELLALLLCSTQLLDHLESGVEIETAETISKIEEVHPSPALEVIDVESESSAFHVFRSEFSHL